MNHGATYAGLSPAALLHRRRLERVSGVVTNATSAPGNLLVDFGCSDGYVLATLLQADCIPDSWSVAGYDHSGELIARARDRGLERAEFGEIDLNDEHTQVDRPADVATCLEVLEHVGDWRAALKVLHQSTAPGGRIVISMPNEVGLVGLGKLLVRPLVRRRPYRNFFSSRSRTRYVADLVTFRSIGRYRTPRQDGWGTHLGFDFREVLRTIERDYEATGLWTPGHRTNRLSPLQIHTWTKQRTAPRPD